MLSYSAYRCEPYIHLCIRIFISERLGRCIIPLTRIRIVYLLQYVPELRGSRYIEVNLTEKWFLNESYGVSECEVSRFSANRIYRYDCFVLYQQFAVRVLCRYLSMYICCTAADLSTP